jgi:hypothetical protein
MLSNEDRHKFADALDAVIFNLEEASCPSEIKPPKNWREKIDCRRASPSVCYACQKVFCRPCRRGSGFYLASGTWAYICGPCVDDAHQRNHEAFLQRRAVRKAKRAKIFQALKTKVWNLYSFLGK